MRDGVRYIDFAQGAASVRFQTRDGNVWWG